MNVVTCRHCGMPIAYVDFSSIPMEVEEGESTSWWVHLDPAPNDHEPEPRS